MKDKNESMRGACLTCDCSEYILKADSYKCGTCQCPVGKHREQDYDKLIAPTDKSLSPKESLALNSFIHGRQGIFALYIALNVLTGFIQYNNPLSGYTFNRGYAKVVYMCGFMTFFWMTCFAAACSLFSKSTFKRTVSLALFLLNCSVMRVYALHYSGLTVTLKDLGGYPLDVARYVEWLCDMHHLAAIIGFVTKANDSKVNRSILFVWALTLTGFIGSLLDGPLAEAFLILSYCTHCVAVTDLWDMYSDAIATSSNPIHKDMLSVNQVVTNYAWHAFALVHFLARFHFIPFALGEALYFVSHVFAKIPLTLSILTTSDEENYTESNKIKSY